MSVASSIELSLAVPAVAEWKKNDKEQLGPRLANMRSSMDPVKIAESTASAALLEHARWDGETEECGAALGAGQ